MDKKQLIIDRFRKEFIFSEHDSSNMTDEEIKEGIKYVAKTIGSFGATEQDAVKAIHTLKNKPIR